MLGVLFCTCLVASNLLETKVVRLWQMPGGHILSVTAGLLVFPISYIINDCIAEVWGYRKARLIIWLGFGRARRPSIASSDSRHAWPQPACWPSSLGRSSTPM